MNENHQDQIDRTLRLLGSASPAPGMEERILAGLARAEARNPPPHFFSVPRFAVAFATAGTICAFIVAGSVSHSHHNLPVAPGLAPGLHFPGEAEPGVGAASAAHVAAQPVTALPKDRPRSVLKTENGRAVISVDAKKHRGIAVPKTPPAPGRNSNPNLP
ncbi:MAG: hypothetical protein WBD10_02005 [Acidobacteriaceae bacterium]